MRFAAPLFVFLAVAAFQSGEQQVFRRIISFRMWFYSLMEVRAWCRIIALCWFWCVFWIEVWWMYLWWFVALSASLKSAEKEEAAVQKGEERSMRNQNDISNTLCIYNTNTWMPRNWCILLELCFSACRWADGAAENRYWSDLLNECISCVSGCSVCVNSPGCTSRRVFTCSIVILRAWPIDTFNFIYFLFLYRFTEQLFSLVSPPQIWWSLKPLRRLKPHTRTVS